MENSHEAIIQPDEWQAVQEEFARRKSLGRKYSGNSIFGARIICGDCGSFYGSKVWNSNSKYKRTIWQCNNKFKGKEKCSTPHLDEDTIKERFVDAFNSLMKIKPEIIRKAEIIKVKLCDCSALDEELHRLENEMEDISELTRRCINENAQTAQNQDEFTERYNSYVERFDIAQKRVEEIEQDRLVRQGRADSFDLFIKELKQIPGPLAEFNERVWQTTLDCVTVYHDGRMVFRFFDGTEIEIATHSFSTN